MLATGVTGLAYSLAILFYGLVPIKILIGAGGPPVASPINAPGSCISSNAQGPQLIPMEVSVEISVSAASSCGDRNQLLHRLEFHEYFLLLREPVWETEPTLPLVDIR